MAKKLPKGTPGPRRKGWGRAGIRGVYPTPEGRFAARLRWAKRLHYCGTFDTAEAAARAVEAKRSALAHLAATCRRAAEGLPTRKGESDGPEHV